MTVTAPVVFSVVLLVTASVFVVLSLRSLKKIRVAQQEVVTSLADVERLFRARRSSIERLLRMAEAVDSQDFVLVNRLKRFTSTPATSAEAGKQISRFHYFRAQAEVSRTIENLSRRMDEFAHGDMQVVLQIEKLVSLEVRLIDALECYNDNCKSLAEITSNAISASLARSMGVDVAMPFPSSGAVAATAA